MSNPIQNVGNVSCEPQKWIVICGLSLRLDEPGPIPVCARSDDGRSFAVSMAIGSILAWSGHENYATSKGGVQMLMASMAQELAPHRIRINSIAPGAMRTSINKPAWDTETAAANLLRLIPYGRIGDPDDIAKAAVWLASDESDFVHGTTLFVDGGMTLFPGFATGG